MKQEYKVYYSSEIGLLEIVGTDQAITAVNFVEAGDIDEAVQTDGPPSVIAACLTQLDEYFKGERREFSLDLAPAGTEFQQSVWRQLVRIPYGQTVSYLDVARRLGNEKAVRAVGLANGRNKISVIIPCHRVIGSDGQLTGYGGGLWRKAWLLRHEGAAAGKQLLLL